jgi:phospholipid/cholesterol/gamma-HCH transport system substrate-binding protein
MIMPLKKKRNTIIGIYIVVTLAVLIWGLSFLKGLSLFEKERNYYVVYDKIGGLQKSSRIMLNGYQVGQVSDIKFDTTDYRNIIVSLILHQDVKIPVRTVARIVSSDLMGTKEIHLIFSNANELYKVGDTLVPGIDKELAEEVNAQIAPLRYKVEELISSFDSVLVGVQSVLTETTQENLRRTFQNINSTIQNLLTITNELSVFIREEKGSVASVIHNIDSVSAALSRNAASIDQMIRNLSAFSEGLSGVDVATVIKNAQKTMDEVQSVAVKLNEQEGTLGQLIHDKSLYLNLEKSSRELQLLLKDVRENPKRYVHYSLFGKNNTQPGLVE